MFQAVLELPGTSSLKEKRQTLRSVKERLYRHYRISVAEVDLLDSCHFAQLGGAYVTNKRELGEGLMEKAITFIEDNIPGRLQNHQIHVEYYP